MNIRDLLSKKELYVFKSKSKDLTPVNKGFLDIDLIKDPTVISQLNLHGHQLFINNLFNPNTDMKRILLYHGTGTGKTLIINSVAQKFINRFKIMKQQPRVIIIGFTENIIINDLMKFSELGYVAPSELRNMQILEDSTKAQDKVLLKSIRQSIKRRIKDIKKGGYYKFFGYQEFANRIFDITPEGNTNNISIDTIYNKSNDDEFNQNVQELLDKNYIEINEVIVDMLKYSFIACDEVHLIYNSKGKNQRGYAIKYILDYMEKLDAKSAPRVLFASATPVSIGPTEAIDLLDMLTPLKTYDKSEFFDENSNIKEGALKKIESLYKGKVSFLMESDKNIYPERIFVGESLRNIPYLKFTLCNMSKLHKRTLLDYKKNDPTFETLLGSESLSLYDIVYPSPSSDTIGLYNLNMLNASIKNAPKKWKNEVGIDTIGKIPSGNFLHRSNIGKYSMKYKMLLDKIINVLNSKVPGKILIYHYFVKGSGVLLLENMLLENGFINPGDNTRNNTRCVLCGEKYENHKNIKEHDFKPATVVSIYNELGNNIEKIYKDFNSPVNTSGNNIKIMIASRVIHEGINFKSIRYMYMLSLPRDISTLIQLFGRAVRAYSHHGLAKDQRNVKIELLISTFEDDIYNSPEVINYTKKMKTYLVIQKIGQVLQRNAIDTFINYDKIPHKDKDSLEGLAYNIDYDIQNIKVKEPNLVSEYNNHNYSVLVINEIIKIIKYLFMQQPVWKYEDLIKIIKNPDYRINSYYNNEYFKLNEIEQALLYLLYTPVNQTENLDIFNSGSELPYIIINNEMKIIVYYKPYLILSSIDVLGIPIIDYNQFLRTSNIDTDYSIIPITRTLKTKNLDELYSKFRQSLKNYTKDNLINIIVDNPLEVQEILLKEIVEKGLFKDILKIYKDFKILVYTEDIENKDILRLYNINKTHDKPIGYVIKQFIYIYDSNNKNFKKLPRTLLLSSKKEENNIIVGFMKENNNKLEFILRPPKQKLINYEDRRKNLKGLACSSLSMEKRNELVQQLDINKSSKVVCKDILLDLLKKEHKSRKESQDIIWFYTLFDEYIL